MIAYRKLMMMLCLPLLVACSTPYRPPLAVHGGAPFEGLAALVAGSGQRPLDVVLVHGMCTHTPAWANGAIDRIAGAIDPAYQTPEQPHLPRSVPDAIQTVERTATLAGGVVRFTALVWSPLTAGLKHQLDDDHTGTPGDCAAPGACKPRRARLNGKFKDTLVDDCLADALIYQGVSRNVIRHKMREALRAVLDNATAGGAPAGPLVLITESLGSKLVFDALNDMLDAAAEPALRSTGRLASLRLGLIFMAANQLPMLGLADQVAGGAPDKSLVASESDPLLRLLAARRAQLHLGGAGLTALTVVALSDPNDLLSFRLQASRYAGPDVAVADLLVSNRTTYFGLLEEPYGAHTGYLDHPDTLRMIGCGWPAGRHCK